MCMTPTLSIQVKVLGEEKSEESKRRHQFFMNTWSGRLAMGTGAGDGNGERTGMNGRRGVGVSRIRAQEVL